MPDWLAKAFCTRSRQGYAPPSVQVLEVQDQIQHVSKPARCGGRFCNKKVILITCLVLVALLAVLLFPKDPIWEVLDLKFITFKLPVLHGVSNLMHSLRSNITAVHMVLQSKVRATNPNIIGASADPGVFSITYKGQVIGHATTPALSIAPFGTIDLTVDVRVDGVPAAMGVGMMREIQDSDTTLALKILGNVTAHVWVWSVTSVTSCFLRTDVSGLPDKTKFTEKTCHYSYVL